MYKTVPHLFEEFVRERTSTETKVVGTGLGMPIVKALVDLMGGTIRVESKEGCGTKTTVDLPLSIASEKQIEEARQKRIQAQKEGKDTFEVWDERDDDSLV